MSMSLIMSDMPSSDECSIDTLNGIAASLSAVMFTPSNDSCEWLQIDGSDVGSRVLHSCCVCDDVLNESGTWLPLEAYVQQKYARMFSHTYCPGCLARALPELRARLHT